MTTTHHTDQDHDIWMRCFTAAITGAIAGREVPPATESADLAARCARIADAALEEERKRRREPKYQAI